MIQYSDRMDGNMRLIASDPAASTYQTADAAGRPLICTVGTRAVADRAGYEAWAAAVMEASRAHTRIADVPAAGVGQDGRPYLMSATAERTLAELLVSPYPPSAGIVCAAVAGVADGLDALHTRGVAHGAVCPSTILLDEGGGTLLAGLATRAPEMGLPFAPGAFTAPEGANGPAADVYALAASGYVALGGVLPYAHAPGDTNLRRQQIPDLTGVPAQVTAALRAAMHPDPHGRPSAAGLRDVLSGADAAGAPLPVLNAAAVGAAVRPVNETVIAVNTAVAGAAAAGIAATAGVAAGKAAGSVLPQAVQALTGKAGMATGWKIGIGVTVAAVLAGAAVIGVRAFDGGSQQPTADGGPGTASGTPGPTIEGVDFRQIAFTTPEWGGVAGDAVQLRDGTFVKDGGEDGEFGKVTYNLDAGPAYADLDQDGDLDAVVLVNAVGFETGVPLLLAWTWNGTAAEQVPNTGHGLCTVDGLRAADGGVAVDATSTTASHGCYALAAGDAKAETITVGVRDGLLVQTAPGAGSLDRCTFLDYEQPRPLGGTVAPRYAPTGSAAAIPGPFSAVEYVPGTAREPEGWMIARLTYQDGRTGCGWIQPPE